MHHPNLTNLTTQYQQTYLVYCYKIMQYLRVLAWIQQQQQPLEHKVKPKSALRVKNLAQKESQQKPTLKSLKHQEKPDVSTIVAMGFPNGAMSAAFRVAFNDSLNVSNGGAGTQADAKRQANEHNSSGFGPRWSVAFKNGVWVAGPEAMFMDEAQLNGGLKRSDQLFVKGNNINLCKGFCGATSALSAVFIGDSTDATGQFIDSLTTVNDSVDGASRLDSTGKVGKVTNVISKAIIPISYWNILNACMDDCTTTLQDKIIQK